MQKDFNYLVSTFRSSIKTWDYFVNWHKVFTNRAELEITLNKLNYLLGKENLREEFYRLFASNPDIVKAFPILIAVRDSKIEVFDKATRDTELFDFSHGLDSADKYYNFLEETQLARLFKSGSIKNLVDYVTGIEVGLDSNGRKNRGGFLMEDIVGTFLSDYCREHGLECLAQARASIIKAQWGIDVRINKSERSFDFAVFNPVTRNLKLFETNFYNGGGSKLKSVCGEFKGLNDELKTQNIDLIWITDGLGWHTAKRPLEEAYNHNDYIFNLDILEDGALDRLGW